ncbi:S10 family peptidase [Aequorivita marina]|uniref:S10 family peptidase n=1 Tax=Aequorivita marina TaxID=3073654 RepID=UPI0028754755|nr:carboxypeptidase [Aequorivita sp. S2608]MDS1297570.1 carboxypeptidase [Aequorivita sp. S2608]
MHKVTYIFFLFLAINLYGQKRTVFKDTTISTQHRITLQNKNIDYTATTGMQPLWNDNNEVIASLHYTYYRKNTKSKKTGQERPLVISFNGGPGSASAWMHIAYTGPKLLKISDEGYPVQPYGIKDNPYSILDVADILYVNPVNTGYSRMVEVNEKKPKREQFFGVNADIRYLAKWLNTFVSRNNKWLAPKYLIGESYGGTRVSGLALALQKQQWMYLNGVILVSPADYLTFESDTPLSASLFLPYYTATAWYHKQLPGKLQNQDLEEVLKASEDYTYSTLIPALAKGSSLEQVEKQKIAAELETMTGIDKQLFIDNHLALPSHVFWKELLNQPNNDKTIGRLDSRYLGIDRSRSGTSPDYNAELTSWLHSFTPAINYYMREELNFKTDLKYNMFGPVHPWDKTNNNTREQLRQAMAQNPYLNVLFQTGYYDGATTYFHSKYTKNQLDPGGKMKGRVDFKTYRSGHMMYLRKEDLKTATEDIREFIKNSMPNEGKPAKY